MRPYACTNCGFWQRRFAVPAGCPVCEDIRHVLPEAGFRFLEPGQLDAGHACTWEEMEEGIWRFSLDPPLGIGPRGYLVEGPEGNVAFEGCDWYSDAALDFVAGRGGVRYLSASHPHAYGALWRLRERFAPEVVAVHRDDLAWAATLDPGRPFDEDGLALGPGARLVHTGGHFAGHAMLFLPERRTLFCGDALKFELSDERTAHAVSCHKAFVRAIPLTHAELRRYRDALAPLDFTQTFTTFEQVRNAGRAEALRLFDRLLAGTPTTEPMPL